MKTDLVITLPLELFLEDYVWRYKDRGTVGQSLAMQVQGLDPLKELCHVQKLPGDTNLWEIWRVEEWMRQREHKVVHDEKRSALIQAQERHIALIQRLTEESARVFGYPLKAAESMAHKIIDTKAVGIANLLGVNADELSIADEVTRLQKQLFEP